MTAIAATSQPAGTQSPPPKATTNPYLGILGVFLGAGVATLNGRLLSVGLPDLRGALHLGFDEASWIPTALNMATMFSGVFVVFLSAMFGARRILLPAAGIFTVVSTLLPFAPSYWAMLGLLIIAGLASGTFYTLTMTFVLTALPKRLIIFGIAAYASDIVFITNISSAIEGWYAEHLSWHWIFWTAAVVTPVMMLSVHFGIKKTPRAPIRPSWRGFAYFSLGLSLIYAALDQGERLDWLNSGVIVALFAAGIVLLISALVRRLVQPNPTISLAFLNSRNIVVLGLSIFTFRFVMLATVVLVPGFLANVQQYRALETGRSLAWVAAPMLVVVWLVAVVVIYTTSRLVLASGLTIVAVGCWIFSHVDSAWSGSNFQIVDLMLACGFACSFVGLVGSLVLQAVEAGVLTSPANATTYSGFLHCIRLFGGQVGVAVMTHFISVREKFHSNLLGLHVQAGDWLTDERIRMLSGGLQPGSEGAAEAQYRALGILGQQVRAQAYTMATSDGFILICWMVVAYLSLMLFLRPGKISFGALRKMQ